MPRLHLRLLHPSVLRSRGAQVLLLSGVLLGLTGCQMATLSSTPLTTTKFTLEQTEKLLLEDPWVQRTVSSTGIQHSVLADGRLQVVVNIKNRDSGLNRVELAVSFRGNDATLETEHTSWQTLELAGKTTQAVRFVSTRRDARNFKVRVRQAIP